MHEELKKTQTRRTVKKTKKRRKRSRWNWNLIFFTFFLFSVVLYFGESIYRSAQQKTIKTQMINFGKVESFTNKEMVIIRNDMVLEAPSDGYYELIYPEGERVKKGLPVAKSKNNDSNENYNYLIELLDNRIAALENNQVESTSESEINKINNRLEYLYRTAQSRIQSGEIEYVEKIKKEIVALNSKKKYYFPNEKTTTKQDLKAERERLVQAKNNKNSIVYSSMVGLVSSYYDGHESEFSILNINNLTVSKLNKAQNAPSIDYSQVIKKGEPVAVVSENFKWYLACEVNEEDIEHIPSEKMIYIEIEDKRFTASLEDFYKGEDGKFVGYFRVEDERFAFFDKRKYDAKLIFQSSDGLAIPISAYTEYEGQFGVFIVERTGVVRFEPIAELAAKNEKFVGLVYDSSNQKDGVGIGLYDEVVTNPKGMKAGDRIR